MTIELKDGFYIVQIDKAILVLTREQFIEALKRGNWWKRQKSLAARTTQYSKR